jgi:hypothetical protein
MGYLKPETRIDRDWQCVQILHGWSLAAQDVVAETGGPAGFYVLESAVATVEVATPDGECWLRCLNPADAIRGRLGLSTNSVMHAFKTASRPTSIATQDVTPDTIPQAAERSVPTGMRTGSVGHCQVVHGLITLKRSPVMLAPRRPPSPRPHPALPAFDNAWQGSFGPSAYHPIMAGLSESLSALVGALVGGSISIASVIYQQRSQVKGTLRAERRQRESTAAATALDACAGLIHLVRAPDEDAESRFRVILAVATQDIGSGDVRKRLGEAHKIMTLAPHVPQMAGREPNAVWFAANHAIEVLGAHRRGETLRSTPAGWTEALRAIDDKM